MSGRRKAVQRGLPRLAGAGDYAAVAAACREAATGFELCARRTREPSTAVAAKSAAKNLRAVLEAVLDAAAFHRVEAPPRARTGERLRWEWLASTAAVVDGGEPSARLLAECARVLGSALDVVRRGGFDEPIAARLRVASAEAYSLAHAHDDDVEREGDVLLALT
jgi:hypothetical protein